MLKIVMTSMVLGLAFAASAKPPPPPVPVKLNEIVFMQYGGGWVSRTTSPNGATLSAMLNLKGDMTYENSASGSGPEPSSPVLSAMGQGFWFARLAADGTVEIGLTRDKADTDPSWVVLPLSDGTIADGDKVWMRGE